MKYITIPKFENTGLVKTMFTQIGEGGFGYNNPEDIENYRGAADEFGVTTSEMIRLQQTHSKTVRTVDLSCGGEGITREQTISGNDGMVTNEKGLMICTVEADCVPVLMLDPTKKVIANVHSGWRGTAGRISANAVKMMQKEYGTKPKDILVCIGPHNCSKCYEVTEEIIPEFDGFDKGKIFTDKGNGKYLLNMSEAICETLYEAGVPKENIEDLRICTQEDTRFSSWRRDKDKKSRILTAIMLK